MVYPNAKEAAKFVIDPKKHFAKDPYKGILLALSGHQKTAYGTSWSYATEEDIKKYPSHDGITISHTPTYAIKKVTHTSEEIAVRRSSRNSSDIAATEQYGRIDMVVPKPLPPYAARFSDAYNSKYGGKINQNRDPNVNMKGVWY